MAHYFYTQLKFKGISDTLIRRFLDPPDSTAPNPNNPNYAWMKLYDRERVDAIMQSESFRQAMAELVGKRQKRKKNKDELAQSA